MKSKRKNKFYFFSIINREYNELNQLVRTRLNNISGTILQEYTYDPLKERIFIKDEFYSNGTLKSSTYYFDDDYIVIQNSSGTFNETYIFQDGVLIGYEDTDGKKRYVLPDHEGSAHIVLDENGNVLEENLFSPFAEPLRGVKENKFSYEAKEYDPLVQDYDFHFRKYNPNLRIFMQPDTLIQNVYDPQSLNRYAFERNNPYRYTDETGHKIKESPKGNILASIAEGTIRAGTEAIRQITRENKELITFDKSKRADYGKIFDAFLDAFRLPDDDTEKEQEKYGEDEADKSKVKTYEVYVITHNQGPPTMSQIYQEGTSLISNTLASIGNSYRGFIRYVSTVTGNILDWYGKSTQKPKSEEYEKVGEFSSKSGGGMSYEEKLEKHLRLVKESNRREGRCKKTC